MVSGSWRSSKSQAMKLLQIITLKSSWVRRAAGAFIQETEHDHIKFQECNWRESKGSSEEEGAINREVS